MNFFEQMQADRQADEQKEIDAAIIRLEAGERHELITESMSTMARHNFMYLHAERSELKGKKDGDCNVTQCQKPNAIMWNNGTNARYCESCASDINNSCRGSEFWPLCIPKEDRELIELGKGMARITREATKPRGSIGEDFQWTGAPPTPHNNPKRVDGKVLVGRNSRCPCGSGKKYKHCHIRVEK